MIAESLSRLRREAHVGEFIPFSSLVAPGTVILKDGSLAATFRVAGIPFETADDAEIDRHAAAFNIFLRTLAGSGCALHVHRVRRVVSDRLEPPGQPGFARDLALSWNESRACRELMAVELYVTLVARDTRRAVPARTREAVAEELAARLSEFERKAESLSQALAKFGPSRLSAYRENGVEYSSQLSFYNYLITGIWQPVRVPGFPLSAMLGNVEVFVGPDIVEVQGWQGKTFVQSVELKDYAQATFSGILDGLLYPACGGGGEPLFPFTESQSFAPLSRNAGLRALELQQRQLLSSKDAAASQVAQIAQAMDGVANGDWVMGEYCCTVAVPGRTQEEARTNTLKISRALTDAGFLPFTSTLAAGAAFFSQLPGNFSLRPRIATLTSMNFVQLAPLHTFPCGKRAGNPWGGALALLETPCGQPFYFNFHISPANEDSTGKKTLANTVILGSSGSGKTALIGFLLAMAQKYRTERERLTCVWFDKDRGAEIAIRAMGGGYLAVENGRPTGFNPFQLEPTPGNVQFLVRFVKLLLSMDGLPLTPDEEARLSKAVSSVMSMPREYRRLGLLTQNMVEGATREEILRSPTKRLARWIGSGDLAWVFDNPEDTLDFGRHPNFGIDGTDFLDNREVRTPVAFYLLHRMESVIDGRRFIFVMDEFWKWLRDDAFSDFAFNKLKTIRKQNGLGVFATQSPSDVLASPISRAVIEQSATQVFLPNPRADEREYREGFKLTENEFAILRSLPEESRTMLVRQGGRSALCRLDLSPLGDALKVLSGSTGSVAEVEGLIARFGEDPARWLPRFCRPLPGTPAAAAASAPPGP